MTTTITAKMTGTRYTAPNICTAPKVRRKKERAAMMVDMAIAIPFIVALGVFLIDIGLYLIQDAMMIEATATIGRTLVSQLGQREACMFANAPCNSAANPAPGCPELIGLAGTTALAMVSAHPDRYKDMQFKFSLATPIAGAPRSLTLFTGAEFKCLTCKLFPKVLVLKRQSVFAMERFTVLAGGGCTSISGLPATLPCIYSPKGTCTLAFPS